MLSAALLPSEARLVLRFVDAKGTGAFGESAKAIVEDKKATKRTRESIKQKKEEAAEKKS